MNIYEQIESLCKDKFELLWIREYDRVKKEWSSYQEYCEKAKSIAEDRPSRRQGNTKYHWRLEDYPILRIAPGKNYNTMSRAQYNQVKEFRSFLLMVERKGIDLYLIHEKDNWWLNVVCKLNSYVKKYIQDADVYVSGEVRNSAKGFTVNVSLTREGVKTYFETMCFPAGGTNIQCFHYRYKGTIWNNEGTEKVITK